MTGWNPRPSNVGLADVVGVVFRGVALLGGRVREAPGQEGFVADVQFIRKTAHFAANPPL